MSLDLGWRLMATKDEKIRTFRQDQELDTMEGSSGIREGHLPCIAAEVKTGCLPIDSKMPEWAFIWSPFLSLTTSFPQPSPLEFDALILKLLHEFPDGGTSSSEECSRWLEKVPKRPLFSPHAITANTLVVRVWLLHI